MKKYTTALWIAIGVTALVSPLFRPLAKGKIFYIVINAIAIGTINFKAMDHVMDVAQKCQYPELDELKNGLYNGRPDLDPAFTHKVLKEEAEKYLHFKKFIIVDVVIVLLCCFFILNM